jgi:hypothetical protein
MNNGTSALQIQETNALSPAGWVAMKEQAAILVKSGFLPPAVNTPEKAIAIALAGRELGIGFMESLRSINIVQGKPTISPQLMLGLANKTKELENIEIIPTDEKAVVRIKRKGRTVHVAEFGVAEARELGLLSKDNYKKQPRTMFQWRALAANLRVTFPDVLLGIYTPEEMGADITVGENEEMIVAAAKTPHEIIHPLPCEKGDEGDAQKPVEVRTPEEKKTWAEHAATVTTITKEQFEELETLRKRMKMSADVINAQLKRMGYNRCSELPTSRLEDLRKWIKGELIHLK